MKKEITLQFSSKEDLWSFWNELSLSPSHVSLQTKTIRYRLTQEEINLAITKYNAKVIDSDQFQKIK